jgi:pre-mRNA-splicing factor ATP-dependent RNA helicase DHX16
MTKPELLRCNFAPTLLLLLSIGIEEVADFGFMNAPPDDLVKTAYEQLYAMSAVNYEGKLTDIGDQMAKLPVSPYSARAIIESFKLNCQSAVIAICSVLESGFPLFYAAKEDSAAASTAMKSFWDKTGDFMMILNVISAWTEAGETREWCVENFVQYRTMIKAKEIRGQLTEICFQIGMPTQESGDVVGESVCKAFVSGFFCNSAYLNDDGVYCTVRNGLEVDIHPGSCLKNGEAVKFCLFYELVKTSKVFMKTVMVIEPEWLKDAAPSVFNVTRGASVRVTFQT